MLSTEQQQTLASLLRERLAIIADHEFRDRAPQTHLESLKEVSLKIENCATAWRAQLPGQMRHFLANASYQKALAWLEENPSAPEPD